MQPGKAAGQGRFRRCRANATGDPASFAFSQEHEYLCCRPCADGYSTVSAKLKNLQSLASPLCALQYQALQALQQQQMQKQMLSQQILLQQQVSPIPSTATDEKAYTVTGFNRLHHLHMLALCDGTEMRLAPSCNLMSTCSHAGNDGRWSRREEAEGGVRWQFDDWLCQRCHAEGAL